MLLVALLTGFSMYVSQPHLWVFDPDHLHEISQAAIARAMDANDGNASAAAVADEVIRGVLEAYPAYTRYTGRWLWNNAGGAMGSMTVLHCSFSEYLIVFGTPVGTEGHTGRYPFVEDFFMIVHGEQWAALPGVADREVYKAGESHYLPRGVAKQYRMPQDCWALEYARGNIVSMLFFGFADMFSSTLDIVTIINTVRESAGNMIPNLMKGKI